MSGKRQKSLKNFELAKPVELKLNKGFPKEVKMVIGEEKYDGLRGWIIVRNGKPKLYTSGGVRVVNGPNISAALVILGKSKEYRDYCLDGEFFSKNWNRTNSIVKKQSKHKLAHTLKFRAFDKITIKEWDERKGVDKLKRRKVNLYLMKLALKKALKPDQVLARTIMFTMGKRIKAEIKAAQKFMAQCLKHKHEGSVFKNPESVYPFKKHKSYGWKLKPYIESDMEVIGHKLGTGRNSQRTGALLCRAMIDGKTIRVRVGGGLTDSLRDKFYKMHKRGKLVGIIVEVKHEGMTKKKAVRFPRFYRIRDDKKTINN